MIKVNTKEDERIAETFPNDPYSNLCIITATQRLNLQQAFLSMDSDYFSKIDPDTRQIDLRQLKEEPLIRVIHSLYGAQLILSSVAELREVYPIILYLGIEDYKQNVLQEVSGKKQVLESVEFVEVSYKYNLCWQQVLEVHMQNRLRLLEDSRNYLQLSKIQSQTFNVLINQFWNRFGEVECKPLNNVLENYFNRNSLKPLVYLRVHLPKLLPLWLKYHHVSATEMVTLKSTPLIAPQEETRSRKRTQQLHHRPREDIEAKRRKVAELENEIYFKDSMIRELAAQIEEVRRQLGLTCEQREITAQSLLLTAATAETITPLMKKKKRLAEMSPEIQSDNEGDKEGEKRKPSIECKEPKTLMHRLGSKNLRKF